MKDMQDTSECNFDFEFTLGTHALLQPALIQGDQVERHGPGFLAFIVMAICRVTLIFIREVIGIPIGLA